MSNATIDLSVYSVVSTAGTVVLAAAFTLFGVSLETVGWFVVLAQLNVFALPLLLVEPTGLPIWMWYLVVLSWVGAWSNIKRVSDRYDE